MPRRFHQPSLLPQNPGLDNIPKDRVLADREIGSLLPARKHNLLKKQNLANYYDFDEKGDTLGSRLPLGPRHS
jgi:hypothetical protein